MTEVSFAGGTLANPQCRELHLWAASQPRQQFAPCDSSIPQLDANANTVIPIATAVASMAAGAKTMPQFGQCSFGVIILGAGASTRMGQPKLLLPWRKTTIVGHLIHQWHELQAAQIALVCAAGGGALQTELDRLGLPQQERIFNPAPERGMFSSIQCAARWNGWKPPLTDWVIALGDQPQLGRETLRALLDFKAAHPDRICQPSFNGRPKHPVILPRAEFELLKEASLQTLKGFLQSRAHCVALLPLDDPGLALDIDRPADYEQAIRLDHEHGRARRPAGQR